MSTQKKTCLIAALFHPQPALLSLPPSPCPQVFQQEGGQGRLLMMKAGTTVWTIRDSVDAVTADIWSSASSMCPADPRARSSQRSNMKNWEFSDGGKGVEGGVSLECDRHSWRQ